MLSEIIIVLSVWLFAGVCFTGLGLGLRRAIGYTKEIDAETSWLAFWQGWAIGLVFLQIWHLFAPVNATATICLALLGLAGMLWNAPAIVRLLQHRPRILAACLPVMLLLAVWLANRALGPANLGDMGLYHLPSVRWNTSYPITAGLGNLHGRLAFNSAHFLYAALFEIGPLYGKAHHFANGLLLLVFSLHAGGLLARRLAYPQGLDISEMFTLVIAGFLPYLSITFASNYSNDLPVFLLGVVSGEQLCRLLCNKTDRGISGDMQNSPQRKTPMDLQLNIVDEMVFSILFLCSAGVTVKLSFAALGATTCAVALLDWAVLRRQQSLPLLSQRTLALLCISILPILLWMGRGVILSGYPAYPSTIGAIDVNWRVPAKQAIDEAQSIAAWSRAPHQAPDEVLGNWDWLLPKFKKGLGRFPEFILPLSLGGLGLVILLRNAARRYRQVHRLDLRTTSVRWALLFLLPPLVALAAWFFSAPNIRFVGVSFWWLGAGALVIGLGRLQRPARSLIACGLLFGAFFVAYAFINKPWLASEPENGLLAAPTPPTHEFITLSGLRIYIPDESDQCWDAPLPCTPYPNPRLRLLTNNKPGSGFGLSP